MRGSDARGDLPRNRHEFSGFQRTPPHALRERLALAVLHDDERDALFGLADLVDGGYVRVADGRGRACLAEEASAAPGP